MRKYAIMPARTTAMTVTLVLVASLTAAASCPPPNGRDASTCDAARPSRVSAALCEADATATETCADRATGLVHALYLARAASEWRKAARASGGRTAPARRWLAHATVLDERVQDDPNAPLALRMRAKHDEALAKAELLRANRPS
jgi:hypothetical protein